MATDDEDRITELEIKLVYQEQLIRELDALVRAFGDKLDANTRELDKLKQAIRSPESPMGPANEPPPHY
ncbi:MAG: SlyX family protein [Kofleriaceae bacterium]